MVRNEKILNLLKVIMEDEGLYCMLRRLYDVSYSPDEYEYFDGASNKGILLEEIDEEKVNICKGLGLVYTCNRGVYITKKGYYVFEALKYIKKVLMEDKK